MWTKRWRKKVGPLRIPRKENSFGQSRGKCPKAGNHSKQTSEVQRREDGNEIRKVKGRTDDLLSFGAFVRTLILTMRAMRSHGKVLSWGLDRVPLAFLLSQVGFSQWLWLSTSPPELDASCAHFGIFLTLSLTLTTAAMLVLCRLWPPSCGGKWIITCLRLHCIPRAFCLGIPLRLTCVVFPIAWNPCCLDPNHRGVYISEDILDHGVQKSMSKCSHLASPRPKKTVLRCIP